METIISIIGFGNIGKLICSLLLPYREHNFIINIVDVNPNVKGAILDFEHGNQLFLNHQISYNSQHHFNNSDFVFHCAGAAVPKGKSRLYTCQQSIEITEAIFKKYKPKKVPFIIVVANPVDIIAAITHKITGLPASQIVGTGTFLDSIRMNHYVSNEVKNTSSIDTVLLGEHGETVFLSEQYSTINGEPIGNHLNESQIEKCMSLVKNSAKEIKTTQEATIYGVSFCALNIFDSFLTDKVITRPVSVLLPDYLQEEKRKVNLFLSLNSEISRHGVRPFENYIPSDKEFKDLKKSVELILPCIPDKYL